MTAAAEQGNARVQQDGGDQGSIGNASQTLNTALKTPCSRATGKKGENSCYLFILVKYVYDLNTTGNSISIDR